jgi:Fanconi anemia group M protein
METSISIVVDHRERPSGIPDLLALRDVDVREEQLPVGDYILSEHIAVERKQATDFLDSLIGHRLFDQVRRLAAAYPRPILIIEGDGLFNRQVHEQAIYGAVSAIMVDYGFSIFTSTDSEETAHVLYSIASREQLPQIKELPLRGRKPVRSVPEQQRFLIEGLPFVSAVSARRLLGHFGSVRRIINATHAELCEIEGIGAKKAQAIREIIEHRWVDEDLNSTFI